MSIKLNGSLYIDEDFKLIYRDPMYKIFIDDHCTKYEMYDSGNAITGYIRLFILNKTTEYINIINDIFIEADRNMDSLYIDKDNIKKADIVKLLNYDVVKESIFNYLNETAGY